MRVTLLSEVLLCYQKKKKKLTLWIVNFYIMLMIFLFLGITLKFQKVTN